MTKQTYDFNIDGDVVSLSPNAEAPKKNTKKNDKRARRFCLTSYIAPSELRKFLCKAPWVMHWALCTHDRDVMEDGTPKATHTHIILYTYDAKTSSAIKKIFDRFSADLYRDKGEPQNTLVQICNDVVAQWHYLIHKYDAEKVQYDINDRICDNSAYWLELCKTNALSDSTINIGLQMFDDMLDGASTRDMIVRYGKEYIYHASQFKQCLSDSIFDGSARDNMEKLNRDRFITILSDAIQTLGLTPEYQRDFTTTFDACYQQLAVFEGYEFFVVKKEN